MRKKIIKMLHRQMKASTARKIPRELIFLTIILILAIFMRFYRIYDLLFWGMDQEYEAFLVKNIITGKHFPLIGVNASDTGLYLGPAFIYFAAIPFLIFGGNPLGWAITAAFLGVITTYFVYRIAKSLFSTSAGLISSLIYAVSWLQAFYDREFWNPVFVPLFSLIIGYSLYKIFIGQTAKLILLGFIFGLALQSHLSFLIYLPLFLIILWKKRRSLRKKLLLHAFLAFLITQIPIILFDARHNFTNTKAFIKLIFDAGSLVNSSSDIGARIYLFISTLGRYFFPSVSSDWLVESGQCKELVAYRKDNLVTGLNLIIGTASMVWLSRKYLANRYQIKNALNIKNITGEKLLICIFFLAVIFTVIYSRNIFEYYYLFFFPWLAITAGYALHRLMLYGGGKLFVKSILIVFVFTNIMALLTSFSSFSYKDKINALLQAKTSLKDTSYSLEALGECARFGGYRYLSEYVISAPVSSYMDSYFSWLYPESISESKIEKTLLLSLIDPRLSNEKIAHWEAVKLHYLSSYDLIEHQRVGGIGVYLLNSNQQINE